MDDTVISIIQDSIASGVTPYLLPALAAGLTIALVPWGGKIVWGVVKKFSK